MMSDKDNKEISLHESFAEFNDDKALPTGWFMSPVNAQYWSIQTDFH